MIEFGYTLQKAREAKGLATKDIAQATHMMVQMVEDLENENFSKIAAPIYGRGFVKLYCEAVGIDPKPLIAEFMDIYNGNRPPTIRMRNDATPAPAVEPPPAAPVAAEPAPAPFAPAEPEPQPVPEPPPPAAAPFEQPASQPTDLFTLESDPVPAAKPSVFAASEPPSASDDLIGIIPHREDDPDQPELPAFVSRGPSRYAQPTPIEDDPPRRFAMPEIPPAVWRLVLLAGAACLILWLLMAGLRALYRATMTAPEETKQAPVAETAKEQSKPEQKPSRPAPAAATPVNAPRQPMKLPALYID